MARARNIKPGFFKNELLVEQTAFIRLLFIGLWTLADREGRIEDRPKRIKLELFPYDTEDTDGGLNALVETGFIERYEVDGFKVIQIVNFLKHQTPHGTEKDSSLPAKDGSFTVHDRDKKGYATGSKRVNNVKSATNNVNPPLDNSAKPVNALGNNTLNPDSLNPDSLNPESFIPPHSSNPAHTRGDGDKPKSPAEWIEVFSEQHGVDVDHRNFHDRKKFWPLATAWTNAGITVGQMRAACLKAHDEAKEPIAWLPAYVDRVLAGMQSIKESPLETPYQRSMRENAEQLAPGVARRAPATAANAAHTIDLEQSYVAIR